MKCNMLIVTPFVIFFIILVKTESFYAEFVFPIGPSYDHLMALVNMSKIPESNLTIGKDSFIHGHEVSIEQYPYVVALLRSKEMITRSRENNMPYRCFCGGVIISSNYVLTSAACLTNVTVFNTVISAGNRVATKGTIIRIDEIALSGNSEYTYAELPEKAIHDIGLIGTRDSIPFGDNIRAVQMQPIHRPVKENVLVNVVGWVNGKLPNYLMAAQIPVVSPYKCFMAWRQANMEVSEDTWCGGSYHLNENGPCLVDHGSPAIQENVLVGIATWAHTRCGSPKLPTVFTDIGVADVRNFIEKHSGL